MNSKDHVTCFVADAGVGMGGNVVKELITGSDDGLCAVGLASGNGAEGSEESGVDGSTIVKGVPTMSWTRFRAAGVSGADVSRTTG